MPRKSELLEEHAQAVSSPVRRSSRLSNTKEAAPAEQPPAATVKSRRWSASDQDIAQNKPLRGRRGSQDAVEPKTPTKARGRRSSITSETVNNETPQESKPDTKKSTKKSSLTDTPETKGTARITRRRSASIDEALLNENAPLTRSRRQSLEPLEVDVEAKRVTRSRRSSIEKLEEPEIVHTPKKTAVIKTKRRASVTLDPIEEQTESRKSVSPTQDAKELSIILETSLKDEVNKSGASSPEKKQTRSSKSPVLTISPRRSARRSASKSPVVKEDDIVTPKTRRSLSENYENSGHQSKDGQNGDEYIADEADKIDPRSKTLTPKKNDAETNISHAQHQKLNHENEENTDQVDLEKQQAGEVEHTDHEINENTQDEQKPQEIVQQKQPDEKTIAGEEASISQSQNANASLSKSKENDAENIEMEDEDIQNQKEKENVLTKPNPSQNANESLSKSKEKDAENIEMQDEDIQNQEEEKENVLSKSKQSQNANASLSKSKENNVENIEIEDEDIQNQEEEKENVLAKRNQENLLDCVSPTAKILKLKEESIEVPLQEVQVRNARVSLGGAHRVSNVFRPKDVDFSFAEPMEVDELSMLNDTRKTNIDVSRLRDSSVDESVDESFKLSLSETVNDFTGKDESVLAGSKTEAEDVIQTKERELNPEGETAQRIRLTEEQKKLLGEINADDEDVGTCSKTCESDDYEFEVPSDDDTESNNFKPENTSHHEEEKDVKDTSDQKQPAKDEEVSDAKGSSDFIEAETDAQLQHQAEKVDAIHSERKADENNAEKVLQEEVEAGSMDKEDVEMDNHHEKTVLNGLNDAVQSQDLEMDQTLQVSQETSIDHINVEEKQPSELVELEDIGVDDKKAENSQTEPDNSQAKSPKAVEIMNGGCLEGAKIEESPKKNEDHGNLIVDAIAVTDNSEVTSDSKTYADEYVKLTNSNSPAKNQVADGEVLTDINRTESSGKSTDESPVTIVKRKSNTVSPKVENGLSGNETNESNTKKAVAEIDDSTGSAVADTTGSDVDENTPERRRRKGTRKLLRTVERNTTKKSNQNNSVTSVDVSTCELNISSKINKYIDSKIADILQTNSPRARSNDSVFLHNEDESMEENVFVDSLTGGDETDTSSADSNAVEENEKSVSSGDSEKRHTDENDVENEDESSEEEESDKENDFVNTMAEEGEEDTPSEDSNAIVDEGESVGSSDSERQETDEYDSDDSFICNEENEELLPGYEFDLEVGGEKKRKSRIINIDDEDTDVIVIPTKEKPVKSKKVISRVSLNDSSSEDQSDAEDAIVPEDKRDEDTEPKVHPKCETSARRSSITILENINVKDIKDPGVSERIHSLMESFTTNIKDGDISMNLSLEYTNGNVLEKKVKKRKSDSSEAGEADTKKTKFEEAKVEVPNQANTVVGSAKKSKKKKLKTSSNEDLKTKTFSLMNQLITDVKNRPKRSIKPSLTMESSWNVEKIKAKPSVSMISKKEIDEFQAQKAHPKDLRQKLLYNSGRVKRIDTKTLLKKRGCI